MSTYFRHLYRFRIKPWIAPTFRLYLLPVTIAGKESRESRKQQPPFQTLQSLCVAMLMGGLLTGCITDATTDVTKAPFDASTELTDASTDSITRLTDGTSQATTDLTEPTREFLSSTTPGAWFNADGMLNSDHKKIAFVVVNFDNLQEDIARGSGEYLVSLSRLLIRLLNCSYQYEMPTFRYYSTVPSFSVIPAWSLAGIHLVQSGWIPA